MRSKTEHESLIVYSSSLQAYTEKLPIKIKKVFVFMFYIKCLPKRSYLRDLDIVTLKNN